jgi:hypothetical protein
MYDIVIVAHDKDFNKIKYVIEYAERNLIDFDSFHLILTNSQFLELDILKTKTNKPIFIHKEQDVIKLDLSKVCYRPSWVYQILLKMFQDVTINDNFLILESDGIINKKLTFFDDNKTKLFLGRDAVTHQPYFNFNNLLNITKKYSHCLISEVMMYDKKMIKKLLEHCNCINPDEFIEKYIYNNLSNTCYPADYELYGNFLYNFYPDTISFEKYNYSLNGLHRIIQDNEIEEIISRNKSCDYISFHTWG